MKKIKLKGEEYMDLKLQILQILMEDPSAGRGKISKILGVSEKKLRPIIRDCKEVLKNNEIESLDQAYSEL